MSTRQELRRLKRRQRQRLKSKILLLGAAGIVGLYGALLIDIKNDLRDITMMQTDNINLVNEMWRELTVEPIEELNTELIEEPNAETKETATIALNDLGEFKITGYCPCEECCGKSDGITSTGTEATAGRTVAVDPDVIPYGTEVVIGDEVYIAEDCGSAIKDNKIDIFYDSHEEALAAGVRYENVAIIAKAE